MSEIYSSMEEITGSEVAKSKPYVVSADITKLLKGWAERNDIILPPDDFFQELRSTFTAYMTRIFPGFELIPEEELAEGVTRRVEESGLTPVSLDTVYYNAPKKLEMTRYITQSKEDMGVGKRPGTPSLFRQFGEIKRLRYEGTNQIALVDDVIFSGGLMERTIDILNAKGINVPLVIAGVSIGEGEEKLLTRGIKVRSVRRYPDVIDQVCERDFYACIPQSGRTVANENGFDVGAPYFRPFGLPTKWASIPEEKAADFSEFCNEQSQKLYAAMKRRSDGYYVDTSDIERRLVSIMPSVPEGKGPYAPITGALNQARFYGEAKIYTRP